MSQQSDHGRLGGSSRKPFSRATGLLERLPVATPTHVPWAVNGRADHRANVAMDTQESKGKE